MINVNALITEKINAMLSAERLEQMVTDAVSKSLDALADKVNGLVESCVEDAVNSGCLENDLEDAIRDKVSDAWDDYDLEDAVSTWVDENVYDYSLEDTIASHVEDALNDYYGLEDTIADAIEDCISHHDFEDTIASAVGKQMASCDFEQMAKNVIDTKVAEIFADVPQKQTDAVEETAEAPTEAPEDRMVICVNNYYTVETDSRGRLFCATRWMLENYADENGIVYAVVEHGMPDGIMLYANEVNTKRDICKLNGFADI